MVTMKKPGETSVQSFSLPLSGHPAVDDERPLDQSTLAGDGGKRLHSGSLEITLNYRTTVLKSERTVQNAAALARSLGGATVCISVGVIKASGLQSAAASLARHDSSMQYASEVGVNSYVRVRLSFLQQEDERLTRTVARNFAPDYSYHMDFPCPLLWTEPGADALSLAEILEHGEATFEVWHQTPGVTDAIDVRKNLAIGGDISARRLVSKSGDVLLGTVTVPLLPLLVRKTGITGWNPVHIPSTGWDNGDRLLNSVYEESLEKPEHFEENGFRHLERVVGGLELSIKFAHQEDLGRLIHAARGVGWSPSFADACPEEEEDDWATSEGLTEEGGRCHALTVNVDIVTFPLQNTLLVGQTRLDTAAACYIRYKLYDQSKLCVIIERIGVYVLGNLFYHHHYSYSAYSRPLAGS